MDRWNRIVAIALAIHGALLTFRGILMVAATLTLSRGGAVGFLGLSPVTDIIVWGLGAGVLQLVAGLRNLHKSERALAAVALVVGLPTGLMNSWGSFGFLMGAFGLVVLFRREVLAILQPAPPAAGPEENPSDLRDGATPAPIAPQVAPSSQAPVVTPPQTVPAQAQPRQAILPRISETLQGGVGPAQARTPCPHCREPIDPAARVCAHCRRDATLDVLLPDPVLNPRQRYDLSRALTALSPKPRLGHWARRLEKGGVMLKGVTAARAESVLGVLRAARVVAEARAHQQVIGRKMTWLLLGGASALAIALFIGLGLSRPTPRAVAARALPSVAVLRCGTKMGSGFFITEHKLLTNEHVATCGADGLLAIVLADGTRGEAHLIASDERLDLALVETTLNGPPLKLASAGELASGDTVMIAGAPMGLEGTFHVGTVSNPHRVLLDVCYLQLDARINPGNSGGPVLDAKGRAVAVVSMIQNQAESIGFAVPLDYAFEGAQPLMPRPGWHPTRGFTAMLAYAEHEDEQTVEESRRSTRVVNAFRAGTKRMVAALLTVSEQPPTRSLAFRLEYEGRDVCSVIGVPKWQQGSVGRGLSKRTNDWMNRKGIGKVWAGIAELDVSHCKFRSDRPIELILCEGDEKLNRTTL